MDDLGWKLASAATLSLSAFAASKLTEVAWRAVTGREAPREDQDDVSLASLMLFAAASAAVVAVAQRYAVKGAKKWYDTQGHPGIEA